MGKLRAVWVGYVWRVYVTHCEGRLGAVTVGYRKAVGENYVYRERHTMIVRTSTI